MQYGRPSSLIENPGGWATEPLWDKIEEEPFDDADYVESPKSAAGDSFTIGLSGVEDPGVHTNHVVRIRAKTGVSGTFKFELLQGVVVIKDSGDVVLTTAFTEYNMILSEGEAATISDYAALRVRVTAVATQKNQRQKISWVRVDVPSVAGEEHSGSGSISGNGSVAGAIKKGGKGSALKSAGGTLLAIGLAGMMAVASIVGGGSQFAVGKKDISVSASISGGGSVIATGQASEREEHSGIGAVSGNGDIAGNGIKQTRGDLAIVGNGVLSGAGIKQVPGDLTVSGRGSIIAVGPVYESHFGFAIITGDGTLIGQGAKSTEGSGEISDGGAITAGEKALGIATGSQIPREKRGLLLIRNPDDIIFIGKKKPIFISKH